MMSQLRNRNWTTLGVILLVGLLFFVSVFTSNSETSRPFDPQSNAPDGLLLLRLWLEEMGYDARMQSQMGFDLPSQPQSLLLVYPGSREFTQNEAERLYKWVEAGNSAAFFLQGSVDPELRARFGFDLAAVDGFVRNQSAQPLIADHKKVVIEGGSLESVLNLEDAETAVTVLGTETGESQIAVQQIGEGTIWLFNGSFSFVNAQLSDSFGRQTRAAYFVPVLRTIPERAVVQLDTYHLFGSLLGDAQEITSIQGWLYYTAWGNATLFAALILGLYLLLQGRRLGPALPTSEEMRRREAAEYVVAMANLSRRSNVTADVAVYQKQRLKQQLGRPLHLGSDLADAEFVQALRAHDPRFDADRIEKMSQLLKSLDHADADSLIQSAAEIDQFLKEVGR